MFGLLFKSAKKTKAMNAAANIMLHPNISDVQSMMRYSDNLDKAFENLYKTMISFPGYSDILKKYNATSEDLRDIATAVHSAGYHFAKNGDFIPVAIVSIGPALNYVLSHRKELLDDNRNLNFEILEDAISLL